MNILLLIKRFDFGGAENYVCDLANSLVKKGHRVWLLAGPGKQSARLDPAVRLVVIRFSDFLLLFHLVRIIRLIRKENIGIIHSHQRLPIFLGTIASRICGIPAVATVHGCSVTDLRTGFVRRHLSRIITIRQSCYDMLKRSPLLEPKLVMIPNGIQPGTAEAPLTKTPGAFRLYYVSRLDLHHARLLKFFLSEVWPTLSEQHPGAVFHVVGDGSGLKKIQRFWSLSKFNGLRHSVCFEGYIPEVPPVYPQADLVMGVGRVAIECLSCGIPLLSVKYNHLGPVATTHNLLSLQYANFVDLGAPPPRQREMLLKINEFIDNQNFYRRESAMIRQLVVKDYDLDLLTERMICLYREVV